MIKDFVPLLHGLFEIAVGASCIVWPSLWAPPNEKPFRIRRMRIWGVLWFVFGVLLFTASIARLIV